MPGLHVEIQRDPGSICWPGTPDGDYARRFLSPMLAQGTPHFIANVAVRLAVATIDDEDGVALPLTMDPDTIAPDAAWVGSSTVLFSDYAREELGFVRMPAIAARPLDLLLRALGDWLRRADADRAVLVNNWLLSTNLFPPLRPAAAGALVARLLEEFPDRALAFRSLDRFANAPLFDSLVRLGARPVFTRVVYYQDARARALRPRRQVRRDDALLRRSPLQVRSGAELAGREEEIRARYEQLYLAKYSRRNPRFTEAFFRAALEDGLLEFRALVNPAEADRIEGVLGYYARRNAAGVDVQTQPIFGYDTARPVDWALYRLLSMQTIREGERHERLVNASAGAGGFKRMRGGIPAAESLLVFANHLPVQTRRAWHALAALGRHVAEPLIRRFQW